MNRRTMAKKVGYQRKGYIWSKSIKKFKKTGKFKNVAQGQGHAAGEEWGTKKNIDPDSQQRRYSKNSPSFDEGVYKSKQERKKKMASKMVASPQFKEKIKSTINRLATVRTHVHGNNMALSDTVGSWANHLKKKIAEPNPFRAIHSNEPMSGPIRKKTEMAHKMPVKKVTQAELQARRESKNPGKYSEAAKQKNREELHRSMAKASGVSEQFKNEHQSRIGRSYND